MTFFFNLDLKHKKKKAPAPARPLLLDPARPRLPRLQGRLRRRRAGVRGVFFCCERKRRIFFFSVPLHALGLHRRFHLLFARARDDPSASLDRRGPRERRPEPRDPDLRARERPRGGGAGLWVRAGRGGDGGEAGRASFVVWVRRLAFQRRGRVQEGERREGRRGRKRRRGGRKRTREDEGARRQLPSLPSPHPRALQPHLLFSASLLFFCALLARALVRRRDLRRRLPALAERADASQLGVLRRRRRHLHQLLLERPGLAPRLSEARRKGPA